MAATVAPGLRALLERVIDYAGTFPPATLPRDVAISNYVLNRQIRHSWMLRWLVIGAGDLEHIPRELDGMLSVLSEVDEPRAATIVTKQNLVPERPTYCEVSLRELDEVKRAGCFAKLRTGGVKPDAIPSNDAIADFIRPVQHCGCHSRQRPGCIIRSGLHIPDLRRRRARAVMHGS